MAEIVFVPRQRASFLTTEQRTKLQAYLNNTPVPDDGEGDGQSGGSGGGGAALASTAPVAIAGAAVVGVATTAARADHVHAGVRSFAGRAGAVVAAVGDYNSDHIANSSAIEADTVSDALETLQSTIANIPPAADLGNAEPPAIGTGGAGSATTAARSDHTHDGVTSFAGRQGAVVPAADDYAASEVTNDSGVTGATVAAALDGLFAALDSVGGGGGGMSGPVALLDDQSGLRINTDVDSSELYVQKITGHRALAISGANSAIPRYLQTSMMQHRVMLGHSGGTGVNATLATGGTTGHSTASIAPTNSGARINQFDRTRVTVANTDSATACRALNMPVMRGNAARKGGFFCFFRFALPQNAVASPARVLVGLNMDLTGGIASNINFWDLSFTGNSLQFIGFAAGPNASSQASLHMMCHGGQGSTPIVREDTGLLNTTDCYFEAALYCAQQGTAIEWAVRRLDDSGDSAWVAGSRSTEIPDTNRLLYPGMAIRANSPPAANFGDLMSIYCEQLAY